MGGLSPDINKIKGERKLRKQPVRKMTLRWHKQRTLLETIVMQIGLMPLVNYLMIRVMEILPERNPWIVLIVITNIVMLVVFMIIYICIAKKAKNEKYIVFTHEKKCIKGNKEICYSQIRVGQNVTQRMFGLVTLKFKNSVDTITLRNVSTDAIKYLE